MVTKLANRVRPPRTTPDNSALIGTAEFCQVLDNISRQTFQIWKSLGRIGPQRVNAYGHPKWSRAEVLAWVRERNHKGELHDAATWPAKWKAMNHHRDGTGWR